MSKQAVDKRWMAIAASIFLAFAALLGFGVAPVEAARISDVRGTKHNLSAAADNSTYTRPGGATGTVPTRNIKATSETQICVFCHTPHAATSGAAPLWNRKVAGTTYTQSYVLYDSSTLDAKQVQGSLEQPGGSSKLCLSCHDGTVAIGNVNVLSGVDYRSSAKTTANIATTGGTTMPTGSGASTGFTRNLGTDLTNDHPISVSFNSNLVNRDGEMRLPDNSLVGLRSAGVRPKLPLEKTGATVANEAQIQCASCHDPHIRESNEASVGNQKFLRLNRFQEKNPPSTTGFDSTDNSGDIICLACHDKNNGLGSWAYSVHANPNVADETYSSTHATRREFPANMPVWKAACLNCHDTHTVQGANRLLREGTDENVSTLATPKPGGAGKAALEETCYQCHDGGANGTLNANSSVPNIRSDFFSLAKRMPITNTAQGTSPEVHDISSNFSDAYIDCSTAGSRCGKDFVEPRSKLGVGNLANRHVECTDCHNPHRMIRAQNGLPGQLTANNTKDGKVNGASGGAHKHTDDANTTHTNRISGVLRGTWGVEPTYGADASFHKMPTGYTVKRGDPGSDQINDCNSAANKATCDTKTYVTREYQICLKCHSDYGYTDDNVYPSGTSRPELGGTNLTAKDLSRVTNSYTRYTNQAKEFQAPTGHKGQTTTTDSGASSSYSTNNHRSWHPVMDVTGRTGVVRANNNSSNDISSNWRYPWRNAVGTQTMYCTDCHGSATGSTTVIPNTTNPWGPHGSNNNFLLKGPWTTSTGNGSTNDLCFRCHDSSVYVTTSNTRTGFWIGSGSRATGNDGHKIHNTVGSLSIKCNWCHVAVPHGWKNKGLLVNLMDVGPEAGITAGTEIPDADIKGVGYSNGPYYRNAMLKIKSFAVSGNWSIGNCGKGSGDDGSRAWMKDNTCNNPP